MADNGKLIGNHLKPLAYGKQNVSKKFNGHKNEVSKYPTNYSYTAKLAYDDDDEIGRVGRGSSLENTKIVFSAVDSQPTFNRNESSKRPSYHSPSFALQDFERRYPSANMEKSPLPTKKRLKFFLKTLMEGSIGGGHANNHLDDNDFSYPMIDVLESGPHHYHHHVDKEAIFMGSNEEPMLMSKMGEILSSHGSEDDGLIYPAYHLACDSPPYTNEGLYGASSTSSTRNMLQLPLHLQNPIISNNPSSINNGGTLGNAPNFTEYPDPRNPYDSNLSSDALVGCRDDPGTMAGRIMTGSSFRKKNLLCCLAAAEDSGTKTTRNSGDDAYNSNHNHGISAIATNRGGGGRGRSNNRVPDGHFNNPLVECVTCKHTHIPQLFERSSPAWWNPRFDSEVLERQLRKTSIPLIKRQFRIALCFVAISLIVWSSYLAGAAYTSSWREITVACCCILFLLLLSLCVTFTPLYDKYYVHLSVIWSIGICILSLITFSRRHGGYYIFNPNQRSIISTATLSFFANFTTSLQIIVLVYTFTNAPLLVTLFLACLYSVTFITLSALRLSDEGNLRFWRKEGTDQNIYKLLGFEILLHFCLHILGIHIFLMNQVRLHSTFWQIGQSLIAKKSLELERKLKEKIIHSVMPPSVANELMQPNNEEELSSRRRKSSSFPLWHHHLHQQQLHAHIANPVTNSNYTHNITPTQGRRDAGGSSSGGGGKEGGTVKRAAKNFFTFPSFRHFNKKQHHANSDDRDDSFSTKGEAAVGDRRPANHNQKAKKKHGGKHDNNNNVYHPFKSVTAAEYEVSAPVNNALTSPGEMPELNRPLLTPPTPHITSSNNKNAATTTTLPPSNYSLPPLSPSPTPATPTTTTTAAANKPLMIFRPFKMNKMDNVSILFADIVGFTQMSSNKSAAVLVALLNDLFGRFDKLCEACGCEKIATLGDCYYCISGCPSPRSDHAVCCVRMGLSMIIAIRDFDRDNHQNVNMRVGIHTGTVLCGVVGTRRFKFDVWSNDVTLANKLESTGKPGRVHISQTTLDALGDKYECESGEPYEGIPTYFIVKPKNPKHGPLVANVPNRFQLVTSNLGGGGGGHYSHSTAGPMFSAYAGTGPGPAPLIRQQRFSVNTEPPNDTRLLPLPTSGTEPHPPVNGHSELALPSSISVSHFPSTTAGPDSLKSVFDSQSPMTYTTVTNSSISPIAAPAEPLAITEPLFSRTCSDPDLLILGNEGGGAFDNTKNPSSSHDTDRPLLVPEDCLTLNGTTVEPAVSPIFYGDMATALPPSSSADEGTTGASPSLGLTIGTSLPSTSRPTMSLNTDSLIPTSMTDTFIATSQQPSTSSTSLLSFLPATKKNGGIGVGRVNQSSLTSGQNPYRQLKKVSADSSLFGRPFKDPHHHRSHDGSAGVVMNRQMSAGNIYSSHSSITDLVAERYDVNHAAGYYLFNDDTRMLSGSAAVPGSIAAGFHFAGRRIPSALAKDVKFIQKQQKYDIHLVSCIKEDMLNNKKNYFSNPPINFCCLTFKDPDLEYAYRHHLFTAAPIKPFPVAPSSLPSEILGGGPLDFPAESFPEPGGGGGSVPVGRITTAADDSGVSSGYDVEADDKLENDGEDVTTGQSSRSFSTWTTFASPNFTLFTEVCVSVIILSMMFIASFVLLDRPKDPITISIWIFALLFEIGVIFYVGSEELPICQCRYLRRGFNLAPRRGGKGDSSSGNHQKQRKGDETSPAGKTRSKKWKGGKGGFSGIGGPPPTRFEVYLAKSRNIFNRWWVRQVFGLVIASLPAAALLVAYFRISPSLRSAEAQYYDFLLVLALLHLINLVQLLSWLKALLSAIVAGVIVTFITLEFCSRTTTLKFLTMIQDPNERSKLLPAKLYYYITLPDRRFNRLFDVFGLGARQGRPQPPPSVGSSSNIHAYGGPRLFHSAAYQPSYLVDGVITFDSAAPGGLTNPRLIAAAASVSGDASMTNRLNLSDARFARPITNLLNILKSPHSAPHVPLNMTKANLTLLKATAGLGGGGAFRTNLNPNLLFSNFSVGNAAPTAVYHITEEGVVETSRENVASVPVFCLELILGVALIFLLVIILNREFEINYRLNFKGRDRAQRDKEIILLHKNQAEWLLHNIIPKHVVEQLKETSRYSKNHKNVGVIFATIVNFNELYDESFEGGKECLRVLNEVIGDFDELLDKPQYRDIEKIKTIGSTFMAASGLNNVVTDEEAVSLTTDTSRPVNGNGKISSNPPSTTMPVIRTPRSSEQDIAHLVSLMDFAFDMLTVVDNFNRDLLEFNFILRIGYNIGDVTAGVIGTTKLYYDIWGDAVNIASRMDSTGVHNRIQVPAHVVPVLQDYFEFQYRGEVYAKGKGQVATYLVKGRV